MRYFLSAILVLLLLAGCTKEAPPEPVSPNTELITAKPWIFNEYYTDYGTSAQKRVYKRNAPGNTVDFSVYQYIFYRDGSFELKVGTETTRSTWKFIDGEAGIEISSGSGNPTLLKILVLDGNTFEWVREKYYAKMIRK